MTHEPSTQRFSPVAADDAATHEVKDPERLVLAENMASLLGAQSASSFVDKVVGNAARLMIDAINRLMGQGISRDDAFLKVKANFEKLNKAGSHIDVDSLMR